MEMQGEQLSFFPSEIVSLLVGLFNMAQKQPSMQQHAAEVTVPHTPSFSPQMFILLVHTHGFKEKRRQWVSHGRGWAPNQAAPSSALKSLPQGEEQLLVESAGKLYPKQEAVTRCWGRGASTVWRLHLFSPRAPPLLRALVWKEPLNQQWRDPCIEKMQEQQFQHPTAQIAIFGFSVALETVEARTQSVSLLVINFKSPLFKKL